MSEYFCCNIMCLRKISVVIFLKCAVSSVFLYTPLNSGEAKLAWYFSLSPFIPSSLPLSSSLISSLHSTSDASLTPQNILQATSDVDYNDLNICLDVPDSVYWQINANPSYPTEVKRREAMIVYYLNTIPLASWATLAGGLYRMKEHVSLEAVRKYLHHTTG